MITRKAKEIAVFGMVLTTLLNFFSFGYAWSNPLNDAVNLIKESYVKSEPKPDKTLYDLVNELKQSLDKKTEQKKEESSVKIDKKIDEPVYEKEKITQSEQKELESEVTVAKDYSEYKRRVFMGDVNPGEKVAYLTFDDGPSQNTPRVLEILENYGIKATFFVNYRKGAENIYKRIVSEGHSIGNHTKTHNYSSIYSSLDNFLSDFKEMENILYDITGKKPNIARLPGGTDNNIGKKYGEEFIMYKIVDWLNDNNYKFFDWNSYALDAESEPVTKDQMVENVLKKMEKNHVMLVLMHDNKPKEKTVDVLPSIIEGLIKNGYEFRALNENSYTVQFYQDPNFEYN